MKLLTFYSDSHKQLYEDFFLKSFNKYLKDSFTLNAKHIKQLSKSGAYETAGFAETMIDKINHVIDNIDIEDSEPMVFADCDIQFFSDFSADAINELGDVDIKFQDDLIAICAGFFVCKQTIGVLNFFKNIKRILVDNIIPSDDGQVVLKPGVDDQTVLNKILQSNTNIGIKWGLLTRSKYFTVASSVCGPRQWVGQDFTPPKDILIHHGNWTVGLENKFKLMNLVKNKVEDANKQDA